MAQLDPSDGVGGAGVAPSPALPGDDRLRTCPALRQVVTIAECEAFAVQAARLDQGIGAFNVPPTMVAGEPEDVSFAVGLAADAAETAASIGGTTSSTTQVPTKIGRYMTATLSGGGFAIEPLGEAARDLGASASEVWTWRVTPAQAGPKRNLRLSVSVEAADAQGGRTRIKLANKTVYVDVGVTAAQKRKQTLRGAADVLDDTRSLLIALAAVIAALGGVWWAIRHFGEKPGGPPSKK